MSKARAGHAGADPLVAFELRDIDGKGKREAQVRYQRIDVLHGLLLAGKIEDYQFTAGRRFQHDYERAELRVASSPSMSVNVASGYFGISDAKLGAMQDASRARAAAKAALQHIEPMCASFLLAVLIGGAAPTAAAKAIRGWVPHMGLPVLRIGLTALAAHYEKEK